MRVHFAVATQAGQKPDHHGLEFESVADAVVCAMALLTDLIRDGVAPIRIDLCDPSAAILRTITAQTVANADTAAVSQVA
jgi:hypothetical protein